MKGTPILRYVGNRQEPEEDPRRSVEFLPVTPELPLETLDFFGEVADMNHLYTKAFDVVRWGYNAGK